MCGSAVAEMPVTDVGLGASGGPVGAEFEYTRVRQELARRIELYPRYALDES